MENKEIMETLQMIIDNMATKGDIQKIEQRFTTLEVQIENNVSKKIEALFDGYKLTHEKQWELESRVAKLEEIIEELRNQIA